MKIHILGGGIGGMVAALHLGRLREQGHLPATTELHVYERGERLGGKAVSQWTPSDRAGRGRPGEHGFRFFPNFYRCIVDTLALVPVTAGHVAHRGLDPSFAGKSVRDLLVPAPEGGVAVDGAVHTIKRSQSLVDLPKTVTEMLGTFTVGPNDMAAFSFELLRFLLTSHERALTTYEYETLAEFMDRHDYSDEMRTFLRSLRALSAMRANRGSLRTLLFTATQMLADFDPEYDLYDALLPGPTDYMMLEPWEQELRRLGVKVHFGRSVTALAFEPRGRGLSSRLATFTLTSASGPVECTMGPDEFVVLALPYEAARPLLLAAPGLPDTFAGVRRVDQRPDNLGDGSEPMVGIQFWLKNDVPLVRGHTVYPTSEWAMTSISQAQFWRATFTEPLATTFGVPGLEGVLSVIVSAWEQTSSVLGKAPKECDAEELAREALRQLCDASGARIDFDQDLLGYHVDADIVFSPGNAFCPTPLWVSPKGSYLDRPKPDPGCHNVFVASDWARTETDVGSMESADEAARWTVRAIARHAPEPVPESALPVVRPLRLWKVVEFGRAVDRWFFERELRHAFDLGTIPRKALVTALKAARAGAAVADHVADMTTLGHASLRGDGELRLEHDDDEPGSLKEGLDGAIRILEAVDGAKAGDPRALAAGLSKVH